MPERAKRLQRVSTELLGTLDLTRLQRMLVDAMRDITHADAASLSLANAQRTHFELVASVGLSDEYVRRRRPTYEERLAIHKGPGTHLLVDLEKSPSGDRALFEAEKLKQVLSIPIVAAGELVGDLNAYLRAGTPAIPEDSIALAHVLAAEASVAIANARLYGEALRGREFERALIESLGTPVFVAHPPGVVGEINRAAQELTGLSPRQGDPLSALLLALGARDRGTGRPLERSPLEHGLAGREWRGEVAFTNQVDGTARIVDALVRPVRDASGEVIAAVMTLHDVSELRRVEEEKEQFLSIVSHELRTPLTPLKALAQLLISRIKRSRDRGQPLDLDSLERNLASIERQVDRMNGLVSDLLSVSRAERGKLEMDNRPFDLATSLRDMVERYVQATHEDGRHEFTLEAPKTVTVNGDQARIEQMLMNLIGNAVKYSPRGGTVRVSLTQADGSAEIAISDEGIGITAEDMPRLGSAFTRGSGKAATFAGMGIGLHVAKILTEAHGGTLRLESEGEDRGTTVRVRLPA